MRTKDEIKALLWECCEKTESNEGITTTLVFDRLADLVIELSNQPTERIEVISTPDLLAIEIVEEPSYEQKFRECHGELMDREKDVERLINERDGAQMNLADMGDELDSVKAKFRECFALLEDIYAAVAGGLSAPECHALIRKKAENARQFIKANRP